ncbi:copper amine oxidase N-terminal domain-containing protein [Paenibacillus daejeonensis]|uniref:copper amine oxidase N-terminal domain-containing protein n=1 Tax=Paenibacillus daejeonensis TaxID=135193 RepID=UPI00039C8D4C|nr:copper amine oxidase N-terminal domain-containing protein [Paenibacillus daejeonensis]
MKTRMMAALLSFLLVAAMLPLTAAASAKSLKLQSMNIQMQFDGQRLSLPSGQFAFIHEGRTYIPLRFFANALQKGVAWDSKSRTVTVSEPTAQEQVSLREWLMNAARTTTASQPVKSITAVPMEAKLVFHGQAKVLPQGQSIYNVDGSTYVPVRFMSESVGTAINWNAQSKSITAESEAYRNNQGQQPGTTQPGNNGGTTPGTGTGNGNGGNTGGTPSTGGNTGTPGGGTGGGGGGSTATQASIEADAKAKLDTLRNSCVASIESLGLQWFGEKDAAKRQQLYTQAEAKVNECTVNFERIVADAEAQLKAGGFSTSGLQAFRDQFNRELEQGRALVEQYMKG